MCLAIIRPKGVKIPEEHLHNGWLNNDDGAGFVCIDNEGQFLIHKSMTYEGFIDVYKDASEKYGDTSDFLIHFRIASKGKTTLDNCHPFIVDEDRVIIHNGTLYNIDIDKKDTRSDTKVFAEDWLSQLPANWEDNQILHFMLEDFISSGSKICMLHRTKGIYIYNEDKGLWIDDIWYSNTSYEKRVPYVQSQGSNTFYSFKLGRMLLPDEIKKMSNKEILDHKNWDRLVGENITERGWVQCDLCKDYDTASSIIDVKSDGKDQRWCWDCYKKAIACDCCGINYQEKDVDEYYNPDTKELVTLCDECAPYMSLMTVEQIDKEMGVEQKALAVI